MKNKSRTRQQNKKVEKNSTQKKKYPLRGQSVVYPIPTENVASSDWESMNNAPARVPGVDKGKVIIMPDFDAPLPEFEDE